MKICEQCGAENQVHYKFCLVCGSDLAAAVVRSADGHVVSVPPGKGGRVTVRIHVECESCAAPIPINGPVQRLPCKACLAENELPGLVEALHDASRGLRALGSRYAVTILEDDRPQCVGCDAATPIDTAPQTPGVVPCARCGVGVPSYPAPAWLRATLPTAAWIHGGDPDVLPPESGVVLALPQREAKPIAMACPQCSGGLTITKDNARIVPCRFCGVDVYLPDELWRRLHPVATKRAWTLTWSAPGLLTAEELAEREQAVRAAEDAARPRAAAQRPPEPPAPAAPTASSGTRGVIVLVMITLAAIAIGVAVLSACNTQAFACEGDSQCMLGGEPGVCVDGTCAYPDASCPSGYRYPAGAGSLAGGCAVGDGLGDTDTETSASTSTSTSTASTSSMTAVSTLGSDSSTTQSLEATSGEATNASSTGDTDSAATSIATTDPSTTDEPPTRCGDQTCSGCASCVTMVDCGAQADACSAAAGCGEATACMIACAVEDDCTQDCCLGLTDEAIAALFELYACSAEVCVLACDLFEEPPCG